MTKDEVVHLIPFYVAETLSAAERVAVEEGLRTWPDLAQDLRFWKKTSQAVHLRAQFEAEAHPSAEELLAYAEWSLTDPQSRVKIARHVQGCTSCSDAYSLLREAEPPRAPHKPRPLERAIEFARSLRPVYLIPVVITAVLAVLIVPRLLRSPQEVQLFLTYEEETRAAAPGAYPILHLNDDVETLNFTIAIPHVAETGVLYNVDLESNSESHRVAARIAPFSRSQPFDSIRVNIASTLFSGTTKVYHFTIAEDSASISGPPFPPMGIPFVVDWKR